MYAAGTAGNPSRLQPKPEAPDELAERLGGVRLLRILVLRRLPAEPLPQPGLDHSPQGPKAEQLPEAGANSGAEPLRLPTKRLLHGGARGRAAAAAHALPAELPAQASVPGDEVLRG